MSGYAYHGGGSSRGLTLHDPEASNEVNDDGPVMPASPRESASAVQSAGVSAPPSPEMEPPPSFGRQLAQLIIIPAVIALSAIGLFWLFGSIASAPENLQEQLARLRQSSGAGKVVADLQDPRYKDRCQAAFQISVMIEKLKEPAERLELSQQLVEVLEKYVHKDEEDLQYWLILALGRLGQNGGLEAILARADSPLLKVRISVMGAVMMWTDHDMAAVRAELPRIVAVLKDPYSEVRELAAATLSKVALPTDTQLIDPLKEAMASLGVDPNSRLYQATIIYSALTLATMNVEQGIVYVADVLLNRQALAGMRADISNKSDVLMNGNDQDYTIAASLYYVHRMKDERIWSKVKELSENDPSKSIRKAALQLIAERQ